MGSCMSPKGQIFSLDFLLASSIFLLTIGILLVYWTYTNIQIEETRGINTLTNKAYKASEIWFREGVPTYWDFNNVVDLGLENNHRFNDTKMGSMKTEIGYDKAKVMIGLSGYDCNFTLYDTNNNTVFSFGMNPSNPKNLIKIKRIGIYQASIVTLEVMVWV